MNADDQRRDFRLCVLLVVALGTSVFLTGCADDFAVRRVDPLRKGRTEFAAAPLLTAGIRSQRRGDNDEAAGYYLSALERAVNASPVRDGQNSFATARLVELCAPRLLRSSNPLIFAAPGSSSHGYRMTLRRGEGKGGIDPAKFTDLQPTDRFARSGGGATVADAPTGIGAALVGRLPPFAPFQVTDPPARPISGLCWSVSAVVVFGPREHGIRSVKIELYEPHDVESIKVGSRVRQPLAADFTTPLALSYSLTAHRYFWLSAFFHGDKYFGNSGLYPLEKPSPDKTPVVLVHGLISDPSAFRYLARSLVNDPDIRRHYQVWAFFYSSGLPVYASAAILRDSLATELRKLDPERNHPALHRAVLVGHSMGGLASRLVVSDSEGDRFYRFYFRNPFAQLQVDARRRAKIRDALFFHASPDVQSVVFIATPHRGSKLAVSLLGSFGRGVVSLPRAMSAHIREVIENNPGAVADANARGESSIFNLRPNSTLVRAMASLPLRSKHLYSIIGDRGKSGSLVQSSDGVVAYTSSHLPQARRETVVPYDHSGTLVAGATAIEVARILRENASLKAQSR